jgi:arylsulfatase
MLTKLHQYRSRKNHIIIERRRKMELRPKWKLFVFALLMLLIWSTAAQAAKKPNILVIWGDDIGIGNISAYHRGMLGGSTPSIDRLAKEGALFTDHYGEQSCTAGRSSFITGQSPFRTGLLKVGLPGADLGLRAEDPTIAELLKEHGYATGQFGKNHLGDKDEFLPTNHGFDEFFGNLYHLNAEEEPEDPQYPKDPEFHKRFAPRGVIKSSADGRIQDTGPLTKKRMETADEEFMEAALDFIVRAHKQAKPFFVWFNPTRMHVWTHLSDKYDGITGYGLYADGMKQLDDIVEELLAKLDELGITDNTIVVFSTDNGVEKFSFPDGGVAPFKGEKGQTWEGGFRVPQVVRWPGVIQPGTIINEIMSHQDWAPTLLAAAGDPNVKEKLLKGHRANGKTFKVHLDGYNFLPYFKGEVKKGPRKEIFYFTDNGSLNAVRIGDWKLHFAISDKWVGGGQPKVFTFPQLANLRTDPYERHIDSDDSPMYTEWNLRKVWAWMPMQVYVAQFISTFKEYPQRQKSATFSLDQVLQRLSAPEK